MIRVLSTVIMGAMFVGACVQVYADPQTYDCSPGTPNGDKKACDCPKGYVSDSRSGNIPYCKKEPLPPRDHSPTTTYDCDPGTPDADRKACDCPKGYVSGSRSGNISYCKKEPPPPRGHPPATASSGPDLPSLTCGEFAPIVHVSCTSACGHDERKSVPDPWNGDLVWKSLSAKDSSTALECRNGPTASASLNATCGLDDRRLSLTVTADSKRDGDCIHCVGSGGYSAFVWRTSLPPKRERFVAVRVSGVQPAGNTAPSRCTLQLGADKFAWGDIAKGVSRILSVKSIDARVQCTDQNGAFVGAGMQGGQNCHAVSESGSVSISVELLATFTIQATGNYKASVGGFDHNMQSTMHCGNSPESWVRGNASLDIGSGQLNTSMELETDSVSAGPKGKIVITLMAEDGHSLGTISSSEIGMGGKPPGHAVTKKVAASKSIPREVAREVTSMSIDAQCTGSSTGWFGIGSGDNQYSLTYAR